MFRDYGECKYVGIGCQNSYILNPLCTELSGRHENGKRAECYRDMSFFYRTIDTISHAVRAIARRGRKALELIEK